MTVYELCEYCYEPSEMLVRVFNTRTDLTVFSGTAEDVMECKFASRSVNCVSVEDEMLVISI